MVNVPAGAILFDMDNDKALDLESFTVQGNGSASQKMLDMANAVLGAHYIRVRDLEALNVETIFNAGASAYPTVSVVESVFKVRDSTGKLWAGGSGSVELTDVLAKGNTGDTGGISGQPDCYFCNSFIRLSQGADVFTIQADDCDFTNLGSTGIVVNGTYVSFENRFIGCNFQGAITRHVDFASGSGRSIVAACDFTGWTSEAIRTASATGLRVTGGQNVKVATTGSGVYNLDGPTLGGSATLAEAIGKANVNNAAVGNALTGEDNLITYSLPANSLFKNGAGVRITAWGTIANNVNAKTLKVYFGTQIVLTFVMPTSVARKWRVVAEVFRTGASTQDWVAALHGDATDVLDLEQGTATQTDTAAITIKCTGEAVDNNDIVQEGLLVEFLG